MEYCDYCQTGPRQRAVRREGMDSAALVCRGCVGYAVNDFIARNYLVRLTIIAYPPSKEEE
jgi:hypothetical protein